MINLSSNNGIRFLESVCFSKTIFAFDFDGTLSKIVERPEDAHISSKTLALLRQLGELAPLAIISGRSLSDLKKKFDPSPGYLIGNHGLEGIHSEHQKLEQFRDSCEQWKQFFKRTLSHNKVDMASIEIEDKTYSIAIHYRKSRTKKAAKSIILDSLSTLTPSARIILGKCVVNIIPTGAPHKGIALLELMLKSDTKSAFYIGDDDTDEDVFALGDPRIFTVRVGRKQQSQARFFIDRQSEINTLLEKIIEFLRRDFVHVKGVRSATQRTS